MSADRDELTLDDAPALAEQLAAGRGELQPDFMIALACAALVHAALIAGVGRSPLPRHLGAADGSTRTINVELVDEADLRERASGSNAAEPAAAEPAAAGAPAAKPAVAKPQPAPAVEPEAADALRPAETAPAQKWAAVPAPSTDSPQRTSPPDDVPKEGKKKPEAKDKLVPPPRLDLTVPLGLTLREAANVGSSSATRPPGITRSGENDRFGRSVIGALRKTMPESPGPKGRVTVRIFLNEKGNVSKVQLLQSGGNSELDQNVVFSVYQASFPFPPKGATLADRTFRVTYVYR